MAHYDLKQKYVADLVLAMNGSNRSYPEKWSFAPALSLAYIFANNEAKALNFGKIRLSGAIQHLDYVPINGIWLENYNSFHISPPRISNLRLHISLISVPTCNLSGISI